MLPYSLCSAWSGSYRPNESGVVGGDYDLACTETRFVEQLKWRNRPVLAIGDEPFPLIAFDTSDGMYIARVVHTDSRPILIENLRSMRAPTGDAWEVTQWCPDELEYLVFDSVIAGVDLDSRVSFGVRFSSVNTALRLQTHDVAFRGSRVVTTHFPGAHLLPVEGVARA